MKLQHSLGGLEGLRPVTFEKRVFVEPWEKRIFGIHVAMMALSSQLPLPPTPSGFKTVWTWADLRKGAESLNPFDYFKYRYYEKWLGGISGYFIEKGYITEAELEARTQQMLRNPSTASATGGDPAICVIGLVSSIPCIRGPTPISPPPVPTESVRRCRSTASASTQRRSGKATPKRT